MSNIWSVLGIAPTSDIPAIRRAYAEKLRGIDQEKDAAGFMGLRNAFTTALRMSGQASAPAACAGAGHAPPAPEP